MWGDVTTNSVSLTFAFGVKYTEPTLYSTPEELGVVVMPTTSFVVSAMKRDAVSHVTISEPRYR